MAEETPKKRGPGRPRKHPVKPKLTEIEVAERVAAGLAKGRAASLVTRKKFSPELAQEALDAVEKGAPLQTAAHIMGVNPSTLTTWLNRGEEDPDGEYGEWALQVRRAQGNFELKMIEKVMEKGDLKNDWTAFMTYLERRHPDRWRRPSEAAKVQVNIGGFERLMKEVHGDIIDAEVVTGD